jgi:hypothetical protein
MKLLSLLIVYAAAEWLAELTLLSSNVTYSLEQISHIVRPTQRELQLEEWVCAGDNLDEIEKCLQFDTTVRFTQIWLTHLHDADNLEFKLRLARDIGARALILLTNRTSIQLAAPYSSLLNVFSTSDPALWEEVDELGGVGRAKLHTFDYCKA